MQKENKNRSVMILTGEASGDVHGAHLIKELRKKDDSLDIFGIGGENLEREGVEIIFNSSLLAVIGIVEVLAKLPTVLKALSVAKKALKERKPDLLILIDYPEFNLNVAKRAKKLGIKVLYYITPQVWAWRTGRVKKIKQIVDHMAVILPFEKKFFTEYDIPTTYVGHPLLDGNEKIVVNDPKADKTIIGLLPGSRDGEIRKILPVLLETAEVLKNKIENVQFVIPLAKSVNLELFNSVINEYKDKVDFIIEEDGVDKVFKGCKLVVATSGTVTTEAAIANVPMIIVYITSPLTYYIGKKLSHVDHVGLTNIIAGKEIVPELLQENVNPSKISELVTDLIDNPEKISEMKNELKRVKNLLGGSGASEKTAGVAINLLNQ
ncbi:MAG: lipid-A-disaccharide synthase [Desulfobacterales bacterium]|nr:lipid-A-disaccharide synthase [Desulfobacterales bacterium]MCP4162045.1 lipid-A-disaccharide synthase [Deltaproteobacteria bacterium]